MGESQNLDVLGPARLGIVQPDRYKHDSTHAGYHAECDRCLSIGTSVRMEIRWKSWATSVLPLKVTPGHRN